LIEVTDTVTSQNNDLSYWDTLYMQNRNEFSV
jgi:hypothetical protein